MGNSLEHLFHGKAEPSREVMTRYGPVVGKRIIYEGDRQVDAFLGYPYAKPPIGELRFKKPVPPDPWTQVRQTVKFGPRGMQKDALFIVKWKYGETSDDQLYLNVFTPVWTPPKDGFPVMVFIHGGAFVSDSSVKYGDIGIAEHLVVHGVVVVTIQYRIGYLGFFSTGDDACVDNLGLWDMTAALHWVQDNIEAFAGDRHNVTVFGQSAGGASVDLLSLSPHSRDLFHKVCPMAGNASCDFALHHNAVDACRQFVAGFGVHDADSYQLIEKLRHTEAKKFAVALKIDLEPVNDISTEIGPRLDGHFFPKPLPELRKEAPKKKRLVGTCEYEGLILMLLGKQTATIETLEKMIAELIPERDFTNFVHLRAEALRLYLPPEDRHNKEKFYSDVFMNIGTQAHVLEQLEVENHETYMYSFDYCNPESWGILGYKMPFKAATHCTELAYLFNVGIVMDFKFNDEDKVMLEMMSKMWTNFAKYGDPNGTPDDRLTNNIIWHPVNSTHPSRHLSIKPRPEMRDRYHDGRPIFWINIRNRRQPCHPSK